MRVVWLLVTLCSCGRVGFDGGDGAVDAAELAICAPAPDCSYCGPEDADCDGILDGFDPSVTCAPILLDCEFDDLDGWSTAGSWSAVTGGVASSGGVLTFAMPPEDPISVVALRARADVADAAAGARFGLRVTGASGNVDCHVKRINSSFYVCSDGNTGCPGVGTCTDAGYASISPARPVRSPSRARTAVIQGPAEPARRVKLAGRLSCTSRA